MWGVPLTGAGKADEAEADPTPPPAAAGEVATGGEKKKKKKETVPIESAVELNEKLEAEQAKLADLEAASQTITPFERRLGEALRREQMSLDKKKTKKEAVNTLMRSWDKNGDGEISRVEFRQAVRDKKSLNVESSNQEIDELYAPDHRTLDAWHSPIHSPAYTPSCLILCQSVAYASRPGIRPLTSLARSFNSFDADGGGSLDLKELGPALQALQDAVTSSYASELQARMLSNPARQRIAALAEARQTMEEIDDLRLQVAALHERARPEERFALALKERNVTPSMACDRAIGKQSGGSVGQKEFCAAIDKLGLTETCGGKDAVVDWFLRASPISDVGVPLLGELKLSEIFNKAVADGKELLKLEADLSTRIKSLTKRARKQQETIATRAAAQAEKAKAANALREAAEAECAAKEEEVRLAKEAAREKRMQAEEEKKKKFEDRVKQKRTSRTDQGAPGKAGGAKEAGPAPAAGEDLFWGIFSSKEGELAA